MYDFRDSLGYLPLLSDEYKSDEYKNSNFRMI